MNSALMFSRKTDEWSTPDDFFAELNCEFAFAVDVAATQENRKCEWYFGPDHALAMLRDSLAVDWIAQLRLTRLPSMACWMNPPYSQCREFIAKAAREAQRGCTVVCLVPSRTDTRWWHEHVWDAERHRPRPGVEVRFIKGRLKFGGATAGAPFPSVVIVFRPQREDEPKMCPVCGVAVCAARCSGCGFVCVEVA